MTVRGPHEGVDRRGAGSGWRSLGTGPDSPDVVVVDIWRVRGGLLAGHWDVGQAVPDGVDAEELLAESPATT